MLAILAIISAVIFALFSLVHVAAAVVAGQPLFWMGAIGLWAMAVAFWKIAGIAKQLPAENTKGEGAQLLGGRALVWPITLVVGFGLTALSYTWLG